MNRICLLLLLSSMAFGQGVLVPTQQALKVVNGVMSPVANATITVCAANTSGIPCAPVLGSAVFKDVALTQPQTNPFTSDANGNYFFAIAPGNYTVTVSAASFVGYSYQITAPLAAGANNTFTGTTTFAGAVNLSGGSLTGTYSGPTTFSGNDTFTATNTFTGFLACKNLENVRCVDGNNSQGWAGSDFGAWVNSAIAALPVVLPPLNDGTHTYPCGTIYMFPPAGAINVTVSTTIAINSPCIHVIGTGSGSLNLLCPSAGDCMRVQSNPFNQNPSTEVRGFSLTGNGTAASGLHIGDLSHAIIADVALIGFTGSVSNGLGSAGSTGLWIDNVNGFTEQLQLNHIWLNNNTIGIKETDSASACPALNVSTGYGHWLDVHLNVNASQIGYEIGPGIQSSHGVSKFIAMNGNGTGKTFFKMDAVSGSCGAAVTNNNGPYVLVTEDDGPSGGTFINMAAGTSFGAAPCVLHNLNGAPVMTNTLSGTLACQQFLGPTGNQPFLDSRTFTATAEQLTLSSDATTIDMALQISRNNAGAGVDSQITTIGNAGDSCSGSTAGDLCIRNNNSGNLISLTSGGTPSLAITNTGIKSTQGLEIFNTTTTCTTAATAFAVCTTAAITLPVTMPDTSYRLTCTPKGPTNFPVLVATTNSSTSQFTITIEATTNAAASFTSYDCMAGHN